MNPNRRGRSSVPRRAFGICLLAVLIAPLCAPADQEPAPSRVKLRDPDVVAQEFLTSWRAELDSGESELRHGEEATFRGSTPFRFSDYCNHVATGHDKLVARTYRLVALQRIAAGEPEDALFQIGIAQLFWPDVTNALSEFGSFGQQLLHRMSESQSLRTESSLLPKSSEATSPPHPVTAVQMKYPWAARLARLEGTLALRAFVDEKGDLSHPEILSDESTTDATALVLAGFRSLAHVKFLPATKNGVPVTAWYTVRFKFEKP